MITSVENQFNIDNKYNYDSDLVNILSICCRLLSSSHNDELMYHAITTAHWADVLSRDIYDINQESNNNIKQFDRKLELAAFAHEIERATNNKLDPYNFQSFVLYKQASLIRSIEVIDNIMKDYGLNPQIIKEVTDIMILSISDKKSIQNNPYPIILREADSLSFLKTSIQTFFIDKISDNLLHEICRNEILKLTPRGLKYLTKINFQDPRMKKYINNTLSEINYNYEHVS